jgi:hypothetical protein
MKNHEDLIKAGIAAGTAVYETLTTQTFRFMSAYTISVEYDPS